MENENMKFPFDNKEVLPKEDTTVISKMKLRIYLFLGIMGYVVSIFTAYSPVVSELLKSEEKQMLNKFIEDSKYQKFKDSIQSINDLKIQKRNAENRDRIYQLMDALRKDLIGSSQITLYYTHDSGGIPVTGSPLNVTILYTANNIDPCLGRNYWQNRVVPQGYVKLNKRIREQGFLYIPEVKDYKELVEDLETREDLECNKVKSLMAVYIKETGYAVYYLMATWEEKDPFMNNYRAKNSMRKYSAEIGPLLNVVNKN